MRTYDNHFSLRSPICDAGGIEFRFSEFVRWNFIWNKTWGHPVPSNNNVLFCSFCLKISYWTRVFLKYPHWTTFSSLSLFFLISSSSNHYIKKLSNYMYLILRVGIKKKFKNWLKYFWCSLLFTKWILLMKLYSNFDFTFNYKIGSKLQSLQRWKIFFNFEPV